MFRFFATVDLPVRSDPASSVQVGITPCSRNVGLNTSTHTTPGLRAHLRYAEHCRVPWQCDNRDSRTASPSAGAKQRS